MRISTLIEARLALREKRHKLDIEIACYINSVPPELEKERHRIDRALEELNALAENELMIEVE